VTALFFAALWPSSALAQVTAAPPSGGPTLVETLNLEAFLDVYASVNHAYPKPQTPTAGVGGGNGLRAYDVNNGVSLHWLGVNAAYDPDPVGATVGLRLGPSAARYAGTDAAAGVGLEYVKQAYATLRPGGKIGKLTIDIGKFDAPVGSEVADNPYNANYTRSLLNYFAQPFFFTGVRAGYAFSENFELKAIAANGWNNTIDNNRGKTFGGVVTVRPSDALALSLAYIAGPEQSDSATSTCAAGTVFNRVTASCDPSAGAPEQIVLTDDDDANTRWRHFLDLVIDFAPGRSFRFVANADYGREPIRAATPGGPTEVQWYGVNGVARARFTELFALAGRGEGYWDPDGATLFTGRDTQVTAGTLTFILTPSAHVWLLLDNRVDYGSHAVFQRSLTGAASTQFTSTLGVVVSTSTKAGM
jgi:hypothetical protein